MGRSEDQRRGQTRGSTTSKGGCKSGSRRPSWLVPSRLALPTPAVEPTSADFIIIAFAPYLATPTGNKVAVAFTRFLLAGGDYGDRLGTVDERAGRNSRTKILLAEDDNDMRRFLVKALQNAGYAVASFDNGLSAYNRLREEPFELLLTDIVMPEMDGIELARRATELDPDIKVMFITGFAAVALNPDNKAPKDARKSSPSPSICAISSTKCSGWQAA